MPSTFEAREPRDSTRPSAEESSKLRRNVTSFAAFLISPLQMSLLSRALGAEGFGRWWWTFVVLELTTLLGMQGADLYVRRELPQRADRESMHRCVGSALTATLGSGLLLCALQISGADALARTQDDPELARYLAVLAIQPVLANLTAVLAAALQSVDAFAGIALLRGLIAPFSQVAFLALAWTLGLSVPEVLTGLVGISVLTFLGAATLYLRRFDLSSTLAHMSSPRELRAALGFGLPLLVPNALWTLGGKIDLYLLRPHVGSAALGVYAACLQLVSALPNTRLVFDPVVQAQIAALSGARVALGASLQRLSRLCALALLPLFIGLVTVGEPVLAFLLGHDVSQAALPLSILCVGQLLGSVAVASWLAPMLLPRRAITLLAAAALASKAVLLIWLAPRWGSVGAALATAFGTVVSQQGMAWLGSRALSVRIYSPRILWVCAVTLSFGLGSVLIEAAVRSNDSVLAFVQGTLVAGGCSALGVLSLLEARERLWIADWLRARSSAH